MREPEITLVGRSSSHFTRITRIFALELGVPFSFRPVLDLTTPDPAAYADNPALKVPILIDAEGPLYGSENICRALAHRSGQRERVVLKGDVAVRVVANTEEMILHAMTAGVALITAALAGPNSPSPPKVRLGLDNAVAYLEAQVDAARAALPPGRLLSFCETSLYCLVTHLPFRKLMDTSGLPRLQAFCQTFAQRPGAQATEYRFDAG